MPGILNVLLIEDSQSDAALLQRQLVRAGYTANIRRVVSAGEMLAALGQAEWDIVIADFNLPRFDAPAALELLKKSGRDLPFIVVSGAVGEEAAVQLMKAGASDFLIKDNLARLAPVLERELAEAHRRGEYRRSEQLLRENEARYRTLFENSPISLWEEDFSAVKARIESLRAAGVTDFRAYFDSNPQEVRECARLTRVVDINRASLGVYHAASKEQLLSNLDRIIPDDSQGAFIDELVMIASGQTQFEHESVNLTLDGELIDVSLIWNAVSGYEDSLARVIVSIQDISQRKRSLRQLRQAEAKLRSLVEQVPAIVYTENADEPGKIDYVSPQIETFTGFSPAEWQSAPRFGDAHIHPDDLPAFVNTDLETHRTGAPFHAEYRFITRDGRQVWVRDEAVLIRDEQGQPMFWQGIMQDVTERKVAEARLRESERRLAHLMSNLPGMVYRAKAEPEPMIEFVSEGALILTGYSPAELTGKLEPVYTRLVHPLDLDRHRAESLEAIRQKRPSELTYRILTSAGEEKWVWEHARGVYDAGGNLEALEGFIIDVTENKKAEAVIQRQLSELDMLYQNSLEINPLVDPRQIAAEVITLLDERLGWHRAAIRLYNPQAGRVELLAFNQGDLAAGEARERDLALNRKLTVSGKGLSGWVYVHGQSVRAPRVQDDPRYVETCPGVLSGLYVPLRFGGSTIGSISVESGQEDAFSEHDERLLTTIANHAAMVIEKAQLFVRVQVELEARIEAEQELVQVNSMLEQRVAERTADLQAANLELEKAGRLKDEFLASVSHELRTPLTGILGLSEVLQLQNYGLLNEKQLVALKHINTSGRHLLELINDILDLSKIEARQMVLKVGVCHLARVCETSLSQFAAQVQQKKLKTSLSVDPPNLSVRADSQRLKQMIANLLSNAVKFTSHGGSLGIEVSRAADGRNACITVWDTGIGIREEDIPRLFQNFVQLDSSLARKYGGTGLGLVLVKRLAELQNGSVGVESTFGAGSRFSIYLPLAE